MSKTVEIVQVGIADYQIASGPRHLRTTGLGSCVGVVVYDRGSACAGMAHIMLPDSRLSMGTSLNYAKYADTAIPAMVTELIQSYGLVRKRLEAKIAGGAQMFQFTSKSDAMRVGPRNVEAVRETLRELAIPTVAEHVGGNNGRTIEFDPITYELMIRTIHKGTTII